MLLNKTCADLGTNDAVIYFNIFTRSLTAFIASPPPAESAFVVSLHCSLMIIDPNETAEEIAELLD